MPSPTINIYNMLIVAYMSTFGMFWWVIFCFMIKKHDFKPKVAT